MVIIQSLLGQSVVLLARDLLGSTLIGVQDNNCIVVNLFTLDLVLSYSTSQFSLAVRLGVVVVAVVLVALSQVVQTGVAVRAGYLVSLTQKVIASSLDITLVVQGYGLGGAVEEAQLNLVALEGARACTNNNCDVGRDCASAVVGVDLNDDARYDVSLYGIEMCIRDSQSDPELRSSELRLRRPWTERQP